MSNNVNIRDVIQRRNALALKEKQLYLTAVENINSRLNDLLKEEDFGITLVSNLGHDVAGEVVRRYFDFGNCYITVDQMYDRVVHFTYEDDKDVLSLNENAGVRKTIYNYSEEHSAEVKEIAKVCENAQTKLFTEERKKDKLDREKKKYKDNKRKVEGKLYDEFTGAEEEYYEIANEKTGQVKRQSNLQADHVQARETATYNSRYIRKEKLENLKKFYNSAANFEIMNETANQSKQDIRVCEVTTYDKNGKPQKEIVYKQGRELKSIVKKNEEAAKNGQKPTEVIKDITHKATPEQLADATVAAWEKETASGNKKQKLMEKGYLDKNGKVKPEVKEKLIEKARQSQNAESWEILKATDYKTVGKDALHQTKMSMQKIFKNSNWSNCVLCNAAGCL